MLLKKFLNDESKSPVKDFLLWLVVYPFVIVFAVACAINIFQFAIFQNIKFTDWIMAGCTVGILRGTWKAAGYAKEAATQAQIQNNNVFINKMDNLRGDLGANLNVIRGKLFFIQKTSHDITYHLGKIPNDRFYELLDELSGATRVILDPKTNESIYKYELFITHILKFSYFDKLDNLISSIRMSWEDIHDFSKETTFINLENDANAYLELIKELLACIDSKYKELNGSSSKPENI